MLVDMFIAAQAIEKMYNSGSTYDPAFIAAQAIEK